MKSVAFFNNKGGVGKTTLACNLASYLSRGKGLRVLLVDCDPQCNSTQLIISNDMWTSIYWDGSNTSQQTILDVMRPVELGDAKINLEVEPMRSSQNRFVIDVLPGHPRMSIIEDLLSRAWSDAAGGDIGGVRKTKWTTSLLESYKSRYDVIVFDVGPSLGSLNRTVLIGVDYFVTPMGADIFSIVGIRNIAEWIKNWQGTFKTGLRLCEERFPNDMATFGFSMEDPVAQFVGYTVQQYITKSKKGVRRPTQAFENILNGIPAEIRKNLGAFAPGELRPEMMRLGDVPNMYSLIPLAQSVSAPISELRASDGLAGGQFKQQENYVKTIEVVGDALANNIAV